jgi:hypothetical protein
LQDFLKRSEKSSGGYWMNSGRSGLPQSDFPFHLVPKASMSNVKQRALDPALKEINNQSDIQLKIEFVGRGTFRKILSLGFRISARKNQRQGKSVSPLQSEECRNYFPSKRIPSL